MFGHVGQKWPCGISSLGFIDFLCVHKGLQCELQRSYAGRKRPHSTASEASPLKSRDHEDILGAWTVGASVLLGFDLCVPRAVLRAISGDNPEFCEIMFLSSLSLPNEMGILNENLSLL